MRQLTFVKPGLLEWWDVPPPELQGPGEALVRPICVARCDLDLPILTGRAPFQGPFAFGHEFVGEVTAVGEAVRGFRPGDRIVAPFQISCGECRFCARGWTGSCERTPAFGSYGLGRGGFGGALSDLVRVPFADRMLVHAPAGVDALSIASASDNIPDGWRTVAPHLAERPDSPVLVVGGGAWSVGLYAAAVAAALGAPRVDYLDSDPKRLEIAAKVGANPIEGPPPRKLGPYPITVDASSQPEGLHCAIRSTEAGGVCTSVGIYFGETTPMPVMEMFYTGIAFHTSRANARPYIPSVLELTASGKLHPEHVTTLVADAGDAIAALAEPTAKVVIRL